MFHHFRSPDSGQRSQSPELASRVAVWQVLTLGREIEELLPDVRVEFYVFARHDIADRRHTCPNELMLVEGDLADFIQDLLWRSCRIGEGLLETTQQRQHQCFRIPSDSVRSVAGRIYLHL